MNVWCAVLFWKTFLVRNSERDGGMGSTTALLRFVSLVFYFHFLHRHLIGFRLCIGTVVCFALLLKYSYCEVKCLSCWCCKWSFWLDHLSGIFISTDANQSLKTFFSISAATWRAASGTAGTTATVCLGRTRWRIKLRIFMRIRIFVGCCAESLEVCGRSRPVNVLWGNR